MLFLIFSATLLGFALIAWFRSPQWGKLPILWFLLSWLPGELPWAFAALQTLGIFLCLLSALVGELNLNLAQGLGLAISTVALGLWYCLHLRTFRAKNALDIALHEGLTEMRMPGESLHDRAQLISADPVSQDKHWLRPFTFKRAGIERLSNIAYGPHPSQQLDIIRQGPRASVQPLRPVLMYIHGGAWLLGHKNQQALPLLHYLAQQGWLCVDINYRLAPKHRFPDCLVDVKLAIAWLKSHIQAYGGDPRFIAIAGGSAGGHLCALAALTANRREFQPGFETADTRVQAAIPLYGLYDFTNASQTAHGRQFNKFLQRYVMPAPYALQPELWRQASPLLQINQDAPPTFVIQGSNDCLTLIEETRKFIAALKERSRAPVLYAELAGAQHGFDIFHAVRTEFTLEAIARFLQHCYNAPPAAPSASSKVTH